MNSMNKKSFQNLRRLMRFALPYWPWYVLIFVLMIISTGADLLRPKLIQVLIDQHITPMLRDPMAVDAQTFGMALQFGLFYLGTVLINFISMYGFGVLTQQTGVRIVTDLRRHLYDHVLRLPMRYFDHHSTGGLVTRVTNDTESVLELYTFVATNLFRNLILLAGILFVLISVGGSLSGYILVLTPLVLMVSILFQKRIRQIYDRQRAIRSEINTQLSEDISGMNVIQMFDQSEAMENEFEGINDAFYQESRREVRAYAIYRPSIEVVRAVGLALLLWFGGLREMQGAVSFGVLYAMINYLQRFFQPILDMAELLNVLQSALSSSERIVSLMEEPEEENLGQFSVPLEGFQGKIEFEHVWFRYDSPEHHTPMEESEWTLKDVSFTIQPGQFVAFVGMTGAGKSTILSLLARFYSIQRGVIRIDGRDIQTYDLFDLRRAIGIVQQDVFLFRGSILSNLTLGRPEVSRTQAEEAAMLVHADSFIRKLPHGYDEVVMERGSTLSAGERQLLSFARTIAARPSILVLDEATANIDTETEQQIQDAIRQMAENRTVLAVAHRLSTIADADQIFVMSHGRIVEQGQKDELIQADGLFRMLYELQYGKEMLK